MKKQYIVRLRKSKHRNDVADFLEEHSSPKVYSRPKPLGGALPASGGDFFFEEEKYRPAKVAEYQSTEDGKLWQVTAEKSVIKDLAKNYEGVEYVENIGLKVPELQSLELLADDPGFTKGNSPLELLDIDPSLHSKTNGQGVKVAVIDSGLDRQHPELIQTNILLKESWDYWHLRPKSAKELGKVTFVHLPPGKNNEPRNYHGTAVAGILCGGLSGIAPGVDLQSHTLGLPILNCQSR